MMENSNRLPLQVINARRFSWSGREGVSEASDLPGLRPSRIFKDACDWGFNVHSPATGRTVTFAHSGNERDGEGELTAEVFRDIEDLGLTIKIFND
mgnify:CR=1 FL=1